MRFLRNDIVLVDLDFTLFDNYKLKKKFPNENFYSLDIELNDVVKKELGQYNKENIYIFTARGSINSQKTIRQLKILDFKNFNRILFIGKTEYKFFFLKMNDLFFKKNIILYDDFQDYNFKTAKLIPKSPPEFIYTNHINPINLK
ncbi:hypothetical protein [Polaribacter tangerinus]|uniref:hypothetical protein n=1 Tax=Polaribacter tangerinus TaxID=1920034 RepID=UPI0030FBF448